MDDPRRGQRLGWYGGLLGGSLWMVAPVVAGFASGHAWFGSVALVAAVAVVAMVFALAPWRHPAVRFWKLILPIVAVQLVVALGTAAVLEPYKPGHLRVVFQFSVLILTPMLVVGRQCWVDGEPKPNAPASRVGGPG